jgi:CheY-like chemotaxis protein
MEVLHAVRADPRARLIPEVMMTAARGELDRVESDAPGSTGYIVKPLDFDRFVEAMRGSECTGCSSTSLRRGDAAGSVDEAGRQ